MKDILRGLLAKGQIRNGKNPNNKNLPTAYYMPRMTYDCDVEAEAINYAKTCTMTKSEQVDREGYGENVYVHNAPYDEPVSTFDTAVKSWWTQIFQDGINWGLKFTENLRDKRIDQTGFTQMAWAKSTKLGCAIQTCSSSSFIVCRYSPAGNVVNQVIYQSGKTCEGCLATCNQTDGLC
ncbi:SCP-like protein [Oesophagostomum dentatum]|uniref:SCP-like protein n=1 Tax=Oesophagostomum dentatum TaxID=61180 RepID=A0A0B1S4Z6_OESDE|nr:SCP-like protein [Oesophagostomum dentatum]